MRSSNSKPCTNNNSHDLHHCSEICFFYFRITAARIEITKGKQPTVNFHLDIFVAINLSRIYNFDSANKLWKLSAFKVER